MLLSILCRIKPYPKNDLEKRDELFTKFFALLSRACRKLTGFIIRTRTGPKSTRFFFLFLDLVSPRHTRKRFGKKFFHHKKIFFLAKNGNFEKKKKYIPVRALFIIKNKNHTGLKIRNFRYFGSPHAI